MSKLLYSERVVKAFGSGEERHNVLDGVSVSIDAGEFAAVMGASGSGKSTLLYTLSGMDRFDEGEVVFEGEKLSGLSEDELSCLRRKKMGFVFQQPAFLKNLNILDNILLPQLRDHKRGRGRLKEKAESLMRQVGIEALGQREITQVSGGQLQRAGICRALMNDPGILFADEPTGALNSKSSDEIMELFSRVHRRGITILLVTHDAKIAARAQRVLFMRDGKIVNNLVPEGSGAGDLTRKTEQILKEMKRLEI